MVEAVRLRGSSALWFALHSGLVRERESKSSHSGGLDLHTNEAVTDLRGCGAERRRDESKSGGGERSFRRNETPASHQRCTSAGETVPNGQAPHQQGSGEGRVLTRELV